MSQGTDKEQTVTAYRTGTISLISDESWNTIKLTIEREIDTTSTKNEYIFRSYAAQLVPVAGEGITSETGTLDEASQLNNLEYIQGGTRDVNLSDIIHMQELDEFVGESVEITVETGADQKSPILLIVSITGGLVLIAVGIVLIKKFVIK